MNEADPARLADAIRFLAIDAIATAGDGHPGAPLGCAEIATALFTRHLRFDAADPTWFDRDRFVLSNGHGSMLLYALLHLTGHAKIGIDQIKGFRTLGSPCAGHPEREPEAGIEITTGLLGQGIANATGMALAEAWLRHWLGADLIDHRTYALLGDGCLQEGVGQEVISLAGQLGLSRLTFLWDDNRITDDGALEIAQGDDMQARFAASGWHVQAVDGHDIDAVDAALARAHADPRPSLIACRTMIGRGLPRVEGQRAAHGGPVLAEDVQAARRARNWPYPPFTVPNETLAAWRAAGARGSTARQAWAARLAASPAELRARLARLQRGRLPENWRAPLRAWRDAATARGLSQGGINASADLVEILAQAIPELIAGAPDLEGPTQHKRRLPAFTAADPSGRYVHYGVREHAMGAMLNGMAAHGGVVPVGVTYLAFADYMRPSLRMAALMRLPVHFVFSHDSIGIGRNGPTHQPVEILAALRAIPGMAVFRPADATEAAECWEAALERRDGPSCLVFSRQALPPVRREPGGENRAARGAYVLQEASGGERQITLLATGSEVAIALAAREALQAEGIATAVVSMPCWELFAAQPAAYRRATLGAPARRVGIEAAIRQGWDQWLGADGPFIGMNGFGASAAAEVLFEHFGITAERLAAAARSLLG